MKALVTISRQFGSGGRIIGSLLAEKLGVPMYDKELINLAAQESGLSADIIESAELRAKSSFAYTLASAVSFSEGIGGEGISMNDQLFLTQFDIITEIGKKGEGVIVGRCADYVLRDFDNVTNVFIYADYDDRVRRAITKYNIDPAKARDTVSSYDKARRNYYNYHTSQKWGEYMNYDICINTSHVTEETAAKLVEEYIANRR